MKTDEQIQVEIEEKLSQMSEEERAAVLDMEAAMDRYLIASLHRKYGVTVETIPNDHYHIVIDGVVMGYNEFAGWLMDKELENMKSSNSEEEDA